MASSTQPLQQSAVVITSTQASPELFSTLSARGFTPIACPAIRIAYFSKEEVTHIPAPEGVDGLIFVSPHAVIAMHDWINAHLPALLSRPKTLQTAKSSLRAKRSNPGLLAIALDCFASLAMTRLEQLRIFKGERYIRLYAVGPGTAEALQKALPQAPKHPILYPVNETGAEALVACMQAETSLTQKKMAIFQGAPEQTLLSKTLTRCGCQVQTHTVYRRIGMTALPATLISTLTNKQPSIWVATSGEGLCYLLHATPLALREVLLSCPIVVVGPQMARLARTLGFTRDPIVIPHAGDAALLQALQPN